VFPVYMRGKGLYDHLLENTQRRLSNWHACALSFGGGVTMAQ